MTGSRQKNSCSWSPKKRATSGLPGGTHLFLMAVMTALFVSGGCYLYSVNQNAVEGYHMRSLEREIAELEQKNAELRIVEADLRSLHRIEEAGQQLEMRKLEQIRYREEHAPSFAVESNNKSHEGESVALR